MRIIRLPLALPRRSSNLPGHSNGHGRVHCVPIWSCSAGGLPCRRHSRATRCALTAPFHPYLRVSCETQFGGLFSVALSVASPRLAVSQPAARRSSDFPRCPKTPRSSGSLHASDRTECRKGKFFVVNDCCFSHLQRMSAGRHQNFSRLLSSEK